MTNFCFPASSSFNFVHPSNIRPSSTTNCARFSQRPTLPSHRTAFATAPTVCSSRCLPEIHSALLTMAYRSKSWGRSESSFTASSWGSAESSWSRPFVIAVLPVASRPYKTMFLVGAPLILFPSISFQSLA